MRKAVAQASPAPLTTVEQVLGRLLDLIERTCQEFGGTTRFNTGDAYYLTFRDPALVMAAVESLTQEWDAFVQQEGLACPMNVAMHKGTLYAFRSYLYGNDLIITEQVENATKHLTETASSIFVSGPVKRDLVGTPWDERLEPLDVRLTSPRLAEIALYRLC